MFKRKASPEQVEAAILAALGLLHVSGQNQWTMGAFVQHVVATAPSLGLTATYIQNTYLTPDSRIGRQVRKALEDYNNESLGADVGRSTEELLNCQRNTYKSAIAGMLSKYNKCTVEDLTGILGIKQFMVTSFLYENPDLARLISDFKKSRFVLEVHTGN